MKARPGSRLDDVIAEMTEALAAGALFNPEMFGSILRRGDNPILRWRDALLDVQDLQAKNPTT